MMSPRPNMAEVLDLEQRQDEVIRQLDDLIGRLELTLSQWNVGREPRAASVPFSMSPATDASVTILAGEELQKRAA